MFWVAVRNLLNPARPTYTPFIPNAKALDKLKKDVGNDKAFMPLPLGLA
jgi:hypothetical protein